MKMHNGVGLSYRNVRNSNFELHSLYQFCALRDCKRDCTTLFTLFHAIILSTLFGL